MSNDDTAVLQCQWWRLTEKERKNRQVMAAYSTEMGQNAVNVRLKQVVLSPASRSLVSVDVIMLIARPSDIIMLIAGPSVPRFSPLSASKLFDHKTGIWETRPRFCD